MKTRTVRLPILPWIGIIGVIVAIAIWTISHLFSAKPNQVANVTPTQETPLSNIEKELEVKPTLVPEVTPTPSIGKTLLPEPEIEPTPPSQVISSPSIEKTPLPETETEATPPSQIISSPSIEETPLPEPETEPTPTQSIEETPLPEPEATPTPATPKKIVLTPEQALIAAIENQVTEISDRIAPGLIQSIQADFRISSLTVTLGDQWYDLATSEQRQLATQMLQRSQELDFSHLEIMDTQRRLVARNPVVGTEIILFTPVSRS